MKIKFAGLSGAILLTVTGAANAAFIVDTGPEPTGLTSGVSLFGPSPNFQYYAGQFTTTEVWTITTVQGWISFANVGETATTVIYSGDNGLPGVELYSSTFTAMGDGDAEWEGTGGLNWLLPAGTYFVGFEVRTGQTMQAAMPGGVPNPLDVYAFFSSNVGNWQEDPVNNIGFRVQAVPLPGALPMLVSSVLMLAGLRVRSGKNA